MSRQACNSDNVSVCILDHMRQELFDELVVREEVHRESPLDIVHGYTQDGGVKCETGIVDQDSRMAVLGANAVTGGFDSVEIANIELVS